MAKAKSISLKSLVQKIGKAKTFLIATHENPDGDGIGSILALAEGLKQKGKKVHLYIKDPVPKMYHYLPKHKLIKTRIPKNGKYDLSFIVDLGELERVGPDFINHPGRGETISLDHHARGEHNADFNFCLPKQASSGEVIFKVLKAMKAKITKPMATCMYTAMVTDTGSFKYSNTTQETFAIAAELMKQKVDVWEVAFNCFESSSPGRIDYLKRVLNTLEVHKNGKIAWIHLKQKDLKASGAAPDEAEGFINYPRSVEGVEVALAFKEQSPGKYKMSFRSKDYVDVAAIANKFDGGGHIRASGCRVEGSFEQVKAKILKEVLPKLKK